MNLSKLLAVIWISLPCIIACQPLLAQDEDVEYSRGIHASFKFRNGANVERVMETISYATGDGAEGAPHELIWQGFVLVKSPGLHRFKVHVEGAVNIAFDGKTILNSRSNKAGWHSCEPIDLSFGWYPIVARLRPTSENARVSLCWSGPNFQLEPVTDLFHQPTEVTDVSSGRLMTRAMGCANCHSFDAADGSIDIPPLTNLKRDLQVEWLHDFLLSKKHQVTPRSPRLEISVSDANAIVTTLMQNGNHSSDDGGTRNKKPIAAGKSLFVQSGCLACHQMDGFGSSTLFSGCDLTNVGQKRPTDFFTRWLQSPEKINSNHRMPRFEFNKEQVKELSAYLASCSSDQELPEWNSPNDSAQLGIDAIKRHRCNACHEMEIRVDKSPKTPIGSSSDWSKACTSENPPRVGQPQFRMSAEQFVATKQWVTHGIAAPSFYKGHALIESGCVQCHQRGEHLGIKPVLVEYAADSTELKTEIGALVAPSLNSVGDKLETQQLQKAIGGDFESKRSWLKIQMPRFRFQKSQVQQIQEYLQESDLVPQVQDEAPQERADAALASAGSRLVTSDGFGCTSCHKIGDVTPAKAPLHQLGSDLSDLGQRVRPSWFRRWLHNPARINPRSEMPSVQHPVDGVLDGSLEEQIAAVWHVLNRPGFNPPQPNPVRVVRQTGHNDTGRAQLITDVIRMGDRTIIKPFAIGVANRHNLLFDFQTARVVAWSVGDMARQRTEGKTWYWEWAGSNLIAEISAKHALELQNKGKRFMPVRKNQFISEPIEWKHLPNGGVRLTSAMRFSDGDETIDVMMVQEFWPLRSNVAVGIRQTLRLTGLSKDFTPVLGSDLRRADEAGQSYVTQSPWKLAENGIWETQFSYLTNLKADRFSLVHEDVPNEEPKQIYVAPGFNATVLPLSDQIMPTALAWFSDGRMAICSLKGRVWIANGYGLRFSSGQRVGV